MLGFVGNLLGFEVVEGFGFGVVGDALVVNVLGVYCVYVWVYEVCFVLGWICGMGYVIGPLLALCSGRMGVVVFGVLFVAGVVCVLAGCCLCPVFVCFLRGGWSVCG